LLYAEQSQAHVAEAFALVPLVRASLTRLGDPPDLLPRFSNVMGALYEASGRRRESLAAFTETVRLVSEQEAPDSFFLLAMRANLANAKGRLGHWREFVSDLEDVIARVERTYGRHPALVRMLSNLAAGGVKTRKYESAVRYGRLAIESAKNGGAPPATSAVAYSNMALALVAEGRLDEALSDAEAALAIYLKSHGPKHPRTAAAHGTLGRVLRARKAYPDAVREGEAAVLGLENAADREELGHQLLYLAETHEAKRDEARALALAERALSILAPLECDPEEPAEARFLLARLLARRPTERARARKLLDEARAAYATLQLAAEVGAIDSFRGSLRP